MTAEVPPRQRRSLASNIGSLLASQSLTWVFATIVAWTVPRYLGATELGQWRLATSVAAIMVVLASFGTDTYLTIEVAKQRGTARSLVRSVVAMRLALFALLVPFTGVLLAIGPYDWQATKVVALVAAGAAIGLVATSYTSTLHGLQEMGKSALTTVINRAVGLAATLTVLLLGGRVVALAISSILTWVLGLWLVRRAFAKVAPTTTDGAARGRALIAASLPFLLADATLVVYQQIDTIVISLVTDEATIGWYAAADTLFGSSLFVPVVLMTALLPVISEMHARDPERVTRELTRAFDSLLLFAVPIGMGTIVISKSFISVLYGDAFAESADVLAVFGVVTILTCLTILLGRVAIATGRTKFWTVLMLTAIVVSVPLDVVLVPWADRRFDNGAIGGALAYVVTEGFMLTVGILFLAPQLVNRTTGARVLRCAVAGGCMLAVGWPLRDRLFLISGTVSVVVYVIVVVLLRTLQDHERAVLGGYWSKVRMRLGRA